MAISKGAIYVQNHLVNYKALKKIKIHLLSLSKIVTTLFKDSENEQVLDFR